MLVRCFPSNNFAPPPDSFIPSFIPFKLTPMKTGSKRKTPIDDKMNDDLKITNVPVGRIKEIDNIVDHLGINRSQFFKMELTKIISGYPEHMRKPRVKF